MTFTFVMSVAIWYFTRDVLPPDIRIGTAFAGGFYDEMGIVFSRRLEKITGHDVEAIRTHGTVENCKKLRQGKVDVALVQSGAGDLTDLSLVAPLHRDVVHVLVRRQEPAGRSPVDGFDPIETIDELAGHSVVVGAEGSGMRESALHVLEHYRLIDQVTIVEEHFTRFLEDPQIDAAIITTGLRNHDIQRVLQTGEFEYIPLDSRALAHRYSHFEVFDIPARMWPPFPKYDVPTVSTTAFLAVREDASGQMVSSLIRTVRDDQFREAFPNLVPLQEAVNSRPLRLHSKAKKYYEPFSIDFLGTVLESLAAGKELIFAFVAGLFLLWERWRRLQERERRHAIAAEKIKLNRYVDKTLRVERNQMKTEDPEKLKRLLDEVTEIKLDAVRELSDIDLRDEQAYSIFLSQCGDLINRIQLKIVAAIASGQSMNE